MPSPPDVQEKYCYVQRHLWVLVCCSVVSFGCLALSQLRLAQSTPWMWLFLPFLLFTILYYLISLSVNAFSRDFDLRAHRRLRASWRPAVYPNVDVFLPVCGEPLDVIKNTWAHVARDGAVLPGSGHGLRLGRWRQIRLSPPWRPNSASYISSRPNRGWFKKAGNLRYGFQLSSGEYILVLDADFAPRRDLLNELLPYLERDRRIAIVQSPQFFRAARSAELDRARGWGGAGAVLPVYSGLTAAPERCDMRWYLRRLPAGRSQENGGPTLIEHSEDVHTGFDLRRLGWDLRYVPIALATGLCPDTAGAFQVQQYRWCSGSMSLLSSKKFWRARLRLRTRMCYLSGFFYYIHTALFTFVGPLIPITLLLAMPWSLRLENMKLIVPSLIYAALIFPMWHRCPYRLEAWAVRMMYGWAHTFAIWDSLRRRRLEWRPTGSSRGKEHGTRPAASGSASHSGAAQLRWSGSGRPCGG